MPRDDLLNILKKVEKGEIKSEDAMNFFRDWPYEDSGFAKVDHHRSIRNGLPEVIFGEGKSPEQVAHIATCIWGKGENVLITRADKAQYQATKCSIPSSSYHEIAGIITARQKQPMGRGLATVISAGTSDLSVAEECAVTLEFTGIVVKRFYDVGVAGLHRLLDKAGDIRKGQVVIAVAGMDGALPSVAAGILDKPVIAVPTSVGYGASFRGLSALLTMLNSCAMGVGVVNIDNGFGAAALAYSIIMSGGNENENCLS